MIRTKVSVDDTLTFVIKTFPVGLDRDLDRSKIFEIFGPEAVSYSGFYANDVSHYDIDTERRWTYWNGFRFRTEADAVVAVMYAQEQRR